MGGSDVRPSRQWMLLKELPDQIVRVDLLRRSPQNAAEDRVAAGPGVPTADDRVQHDFRPVLLRGILLPRDRRSIVEAVWDLSLDRWKKTAIRGRPAGHRVVDRFERHHP